MGKKNKKNKKLHDVPPATNVSTVPKNKIESAEDARRNLFGKAFDGVPDYFTRHDEKVVPPKVIDNSLPSYRAYQGQIHNDSKEAAESEKALRAMHPDRLEIIVRFMNEAVDILGDGSTLDAARRKNLNDSLQNAKKGSRSKDAIDGAKEQLLLNNCKQRLYSAFAIDEPEMIDKIFKAFRFNAEEKAVVLGDEDEAEYEMVSAIDLVGEMGTRARHKSFGIDKEIAEGLGAAYMFLSSAKHVNMGCIAHMSETECNDKLMEMQKTYAEIVRGRDAAVKALEDVRPAQMGLVA